jgi:amino acid adenylation domain-containing protein
MKTLQPTKRHESPPRTGGERWLSRPDGRPADREPPPLTPAVISLPADRPRPATSYRGGAETIAIPSDQVDALDRVVGLAGNSNPDALLLPLLATFAALLHRYSREEGIVVGITASAAGPETRGHDAGPSIGTSPLRIDLVDDPRFLELTKQVGRRYREIRDDPCGLPAAMPRSQHSKTRRNEILCFQFELHFSWGPTIGVEPTSAIRHGFAPLDPRAGNELTLRIARRSRELDCTLEYNCELFDAATARRMLGHFQVLLRAAAADPGERISALPVMTESEQRQLVEKWNQPAAVSQSCEPSRMLVHELFENQASRTPDAVAIVFGGRTLTYRELDERANRLAHALRRRDVGPDVLVGISLTRSPELVVGLLGILKAGAAFVPLEPSYPAERLSALVAETRPALLITDSRLLAHYRPEETAVLCLDTEWQDIANESSLSPRVRLTEDNLATVMFSSGSTGKPKAISRSHKSLRPGSWARVTFQLGEFDRHMLKTSLDSTLLGREVFWPLSTGGRMIIAGPHENSDTAALMRLLIEHKITILTLVPSLLRLLVAEPGFEACASLRHVNCFGEQLAADVEESFCQKLSAQLSICYGTTEAPALAFRQSGGGRARPLGNLGYPRGDAQIYILDERVRPVPIGVPGELFASGPGLAVGYLNQRDQAEERFLPHPFIENPGARLYRTGDLARWRSDGSLEFMGRLDDQIKVRGYRVEPAEVEAALALHSAVREAVVAARPNSAGENQLVAYIVLKKERLAVAELRAFLNERLPDHLVPAIFARLEELPRTPQGKIDRRALPIARFDRLDSAEAHVAPRTPVEDLMAGIWCDVLDISVVGMNDNFFDLGGHSLLATRLLARVKDVFGVAVTPTALLHAPTIGQLVAAMVNRDHSPSPTLAVLQSGELAPPFFCFPCAYAKNGMVLCHALTLAALARQIGPGYPFYGVTLGELPESVEPGRLIEILAAQALSEIRAIRPRGPYLLGGYSLGGLVAIEVARQLRAQGEEVPFLAFLDVFGPGFPRLPGIPARARIHLAEMRKLSFAARARYVADRLRVRLMRYPRLRKLARSDAIELAAIVRIGRTSYLKRLGRYPGRIKLFRPSVEPAVPGRYHDDPMNGWGAIAEQGVEVCEIRGNHATMLDPSNLPYLAEAIRSNIRDACR